MEPVNSPPEWDLDSAERLLDAIREWDGADLPPDLPRIDGYRLTRRIGEGGGGEVFEAIREGSERTVAIKLHRTRPGATSGARRAWRELDVLTDLRIDCMPRVLDFGTVAGRLYVATEFINGQPLDDVAAKLNRRQKVELLADVADALQMLHEHGVIHRDIKPSNVLVDQSGKPYIIDLGVASMLASDVMETLTVDGTPIGTPAFMSPEQARGERSQISVRSDVYGVGATAMYILTGDTPHDVHTSLHESVRRVAHDEPRDPRAIDATLPVPLSEVLAKAISPDPMQRYSSAGDFAADLRRFLVDEPVLARPATPGYRLRRFVRRNRFSVAAATIVLVAVVAGASVSAYSLVQTRNRIRAASNILFGVTQRGGQSLDPSMLPSLVAAGKLADEFLDIEGDPESAAFAFDGLALSCARIGAFDWAAKYYEKEADIIDAREGVTALRSLRARYQQIDMLRRAGDLDTADLHLDRVLGALGVSEVEQLVPTAEVMADPDTNAVTLRQLDGAFHRAMILADRWELARAEQILRWLIPIQQRLTEGSLPHERWAMLDSQSGLATVIGRQDRHAEAIAILVEIRDIRQTGIPPNRRPTNSELLGLDGRIAEHEAALGFSEEAVSTLELVGSKFELVHGAEHPLTHRYRASLGKAQAATGQFDEAEQSFGAAAHGYFYRFPNHWRRWVYASERAACLIELGRRAEAERVLHHAIRFFRAAGLAEDDPRMRRAVELLDE